MIRKSKLNLEPLLALSHQHVKFDVSKCSYGALHKKIFQSLERRQASSMEASSIGCGWSSILWCSSQLVFVAPQQGEAMGPCQTSHRSLLLAWKKSFRK